MPATIRSTQCNAASLLCPNPTQAAGGLPLAHLKTTCSSQKHARNEGSAVGSQPLPGKMKPSSCLGGITPGEFSGGEVGPDLLVGVTGEA